MCAKDNKKHLKMQPKTSCKNLEIRSEEQSCKVPEKKTLPKLGVCSCYRSTTIDYSTFNRTLQNSIVPTKNSKRIATTLSPCLCSCSLSLSLSLSLSATSAHSMALFELHYNCNELQTRCHSSLSLFCVYISLSLRVFVLALDRSTTTAH